MNFDRGKTDSFCQLTICLKALLRSRILRLWTEDPFSFLLPHSKILQEHLPGGWSLPEQTLLCSTPQRTEQMGKSALVQSQVATSVFILPLSSPLSRGWLSLLSSWPCTFEMKVGSNKHFFQTQKEQKTVGAWTQEQKGQSYRWWWFVTRKVTWR